MMKKIPLRTCVITREKLPKQDLIRVVKNKDDEVFVDISGKQNGKGIYLKKDKDVFNKARKSKILNKLLEIDIDEKVYDDLDKLL